MKKIVSSPQKAEERADQLRLTSDFVFKLVFGRDREDCRIALLGLLNAILNWHNDPIIEITYINPFHYREYKVGKEVCMDVAVVTGCGERIDIELQLQAPVSYCSRSIYYEAKMICDSIEKGDSYDKLKRCIVISILGDNIFPGEGQYHQAYRLKEMRTNRELSDLVELHFLELKKVDLGKPVQEMNEVEMWGAYIQCKGNPGYESLICRLEERIEGIQKAEAVMREITANERMRSIERSRDKYIRDKATFELERRMQREQLEQADQQLKQADQRLKQADQQLKQAALQLEKEKEKAARERFESGRQLLMMGMDLEQIKEVLKLSGEEAELLRCEQRAEQKAP